MDLSLDHTTATPTIVMSIQVAGPAHGKVTVVGDVAMVEVPQNNEMPGIVKLVFPPEHAVGGMHIAYWPSNSLEGLEFVSTSGELFDLRNRGGLAGFDYSNHTLNLQFSLAGKRILAMGGTMTVVDRYRG